MHDVSEEKPVVLCGRCVDVLHREPPNQVGDGGQLCLECRTEIEEGNRHPFGGMDNG